MDFLCRRGIESAQNAMKIVRTAAGYAFARTLAQLVRALRTWEKSVEQGAQVQSSSTHDDRQMAAGLNLLQHLPRPPRIFPGSDVICRCNAIQQVMHGAVSFVACRLG